MKLISFFFVIPHSTTSYVMFFNSTGLIEWWCGWCLKISYRFKRNPVQRKCLCKCGIFFWNGRITSNFPFLAGYLPCKMVINVPTRSWLVKGVLIFQSFLNRLLPFIMRSKSVARKLKFKQKPLIFSLENLFTFPWVEVWVVIGYGVYILCYLWRGTWQRDVWQRVTFCRLWPCSSFSSLFRNEILISDFGTGRLQCRLYDIRSRWRHEWHVQL